MATISCSNRTGPTHLDAAGQPRFLFIGTRVGRFRRHAGHKRRLPNRTEADIKDQPSQYRRHCFEKQMAALNLTFVDELIRVRQTLHGGSPGAPKKVKDGSREGASVNRSCIVLLSALLQSYMQQTFEICAKKALPTLAVDLVWKAYWSQMKGWGNPSADNTKNLFLKIGVHDVFDGLSWQNCENKVVRNRLNELNHIRNSIAHGASTIRVHDNNYSLTLVKVTKFRSFAEAFASRFEAHALSKL